MEDKTKLVEEEKEEIKELTESELEKVAGGRINLEPGLPASGCQ